MNVYEGFVLLVLGGASTPFFSWDPSVVFLNLKRVTWLNTHLFFFHLCDIPRNMNVIIPPHPTHQRSTAYRCQRARTLHQHRSALCITRNMNVIIPPHPTPPHPTAPINVALRTDVSVHEHYINIAVRCASHVTWTLSSHPHPTPPHPTHQWALRTDVSVHEHYINIAVRCASRVTWTLSSHPTPPHPTPRNHDIRGKKCTKTRCAYGKSA